MLRVKGMEGCQRQIQGQRAEDTACGGQTVSLSHSSSRYEPLKFCGSAGCVSLVLLWSTPVARGTSNIVHRRGSELPVAIERVVLPGRNLVRPRSVEQWARSSRAGSWRQPERCDVLGEHQQRSLQALLASRCLVHNRPEITQEVQWICYARQMRTGMLLELLALLLGVKKLDAPSSIQAHCGGALPQLGAPIWVAETAKAAKIVSGRQPDAILEGCCVGGSCSWKGLCSVGAVAGGAL